MFLPLTLEMGSWLWVQEEPAPAVLAPRHLQPADRAPPAARAAPPPARLLDFLTRAAGSHRRWRRRDGAARASAARTRAGALVPAAAAMSRPTWVLLRGLARESGHWGDFPARLQRGAARRAHRGARPARAAAAATASAARRRVDGDRRGLPRGSCAAQGDRAAVPPARPVARRHGRGAVGRGASGRGGGLRAGQHQHARRSARCTSACGLPAWPALLRIALAPRRAPRPKPAILRLTSNRPPSMPRRIAEWAAIRRARPVSRAQRAAPAAGRGALSRCRRGRPACRCWCCAAPRDRLVDAGTARARWRAHGSAPLAGAPERRPRPAAGRAGVGGRATAIRTLRGMMRRVFALTAALLAAGCSSVVPPAPIPVPIPVRLIALNDFHGHLQSPGRFGVDNSVPAEQRPVVGGADALAAQVARLKDGQRHHAVVAAGDLIGATPLVSALFHDEPAVEALNRIGLEFSAVGNHEFDRGAAELLRLQRGGCKHVDDTRDANSCRGAAVGTPVPFEGARFQWLAANVVDRSGATLLPAWGVKRFDGVPVAFIGMTLQATPSIVTPRGVAGLEFRDEAQTVAALVPQLRARGHRGDRRAAARGRRAERRARRAERLRRRPGRLAAGAHRRAARRRGRPGDQRPHPRRLQLPAAECGRPRHPGDQRERLRPGADTHRPDARPALARHRRGAGREPARRARRHAAGRRRAGAPTRRRLRRAGGAAGRTGAGRDRHESAGAGGRRGVQHAGRRADRRCAARRHVRAGPGRRRAGADEPRRRARAGSRSRPARPARATAASPTARRSPCSRSATAS